MLAHAPLHWLAAPAGARDHKRKKTELPAGAAGGRGGREAHAERGAGVLPSGSASRWEEEADVAEGRDTYGQRGGGQGGQACGAGQRARALLPCWPCWPCWPAPRRDVPEGEGDRRRLHRSSGVPPRARLLLQHPPQPPLHRLVVADSRGAGLPEAWARGVERREGGGATCTRAAVLAGRRQHRRPACLAGGVAAIQIALVHDTVPAEPASNAAYLAGGRHSHPAASRAPLLHAHWQL